MRVKRQAHKQKRAVPPDEDTLTRGTAAIFITAAIRVLQQEHGWDEAAVKTFGDRMIAAAQNVAQELLQTTVMSRQLVEPPENGRITGAG